MLHRLKISVWFPKLTKPEFCKQQKKPTEVLHPLGKMYQDQLDRLLQASDFHSHYRLQTFSHTAGFRLSVTLQASDFQSHCRLQTCSHTAGVQECIPGMMAVTRTTPSSCKPSGMPCARATPPPSYPTSTPGVPMAKGMKQKTQSCWQ